MKKYAYIKEGRVNQFLYAFSKDFPNIPLDAMFSQTIVKNCVEIDADNNSIKEGMLYDWETGEFSEYIEEVEIVEEDADETISEEVEEENDYGEYDE